MHAHGLGDQYDPRREQEKVTYLALCKVVLHVQQLR